MDAKPFTLAEAITWKDRGNIPYYRFIEISAADRKRIEELEKENLTLLKRQIKILNKIDTQAYEIERLRGALERIAVFGDETANAYLKKNGSYGAFDEPGSVEIARQTLKRSE